MKRKPGRPRKIKEGATLTPVVNIATTPTSGSLGGIQRWTSGFSKTEQDIEEIQDLLSIIQQKLERIRNENLI